MSQDIYNLHARAFKTVSAFVVIDSTGDRVATIAFKFPNDGAARLNCYLHVMGVTMVKGHADGYGYDKRSAALANAARRVPDYSETDRHGVWSKYATTRDSIVAALKIDGGHDWIRELETAGFRVLQAV